MLALSALWAGATRTPAALDSLPQALRAVSRALASDTGSKSPPRRDQDDGQAPSSQLPLPPPPLVGVAAAHEPHWLDRYAPGLRQWIEDKHRHWWIKGLVEARCKQYHQLEGKEVELRRLIEAEYLAAMKAHAGRVVDERSETHVQVACLALASHKVLLPFLRDEQEVLQIIREHMGGRTQGLLRFLLAATKFLHRRNGYSVLAARLQGLQWDMGRGWETRLELGQQESSLTISRCFYHELFSAAGQLQLAGCTCCSQDAVWFEQQYKGVEAGRTSAISSGDPVCCFVVRRMGAAGQGAA